MLNFNGNTFVIRNPAGTYSYVGSVPACLMSWHKATIDDIRGQRAITAPNGDLIAGRSFLAESRSDAIKYAASLGITIKD